MTNHLNQQARHQWWKQGWFLGLLLVAATLLVYQPAWKGGPVYDDEDHLTPPELRSLTGLARIWTELGVVSQYYPVTHSAFWAEHKLWGDAMPGYHFTNILLHALCALLLVRILKQLEIPGAWLAAAIFALHPVHVESVAWISELKNTLSMAFYLGAALAYLRFDNTRRTKFYFVALTLFGLGLLSKTVVASLPAALLVVFWWKRATLSWKRDVQPLVPFFLAGIVAGLFTAWVERKFIGAEGEAFDLTITERFLIAGRVIWFYLSKLFWPADLVFIYPRWNVSQAGWWQYLFPATALLLVAGLWVLQRRWRGPLAALFFFCGTLFPVMGFLNVYPFRYSFVADHYQYLASLGIIAAASAGAALLLDRWRSWDRPVGNVLCLALLASLAVLTWRQSRMYTDMETLWRTTIARNPACYVAHSNLGNYLLQMGQVDEAIRHCQKALEIQPNVAEAHNNLGNALRQKGQVDEAIHQYRKALEIRPDLAVAWCNLGSILLQRGQVDEAIFHFQKAVEIRPDFVSAHNDLGTVLMRKGRVDEAISHFRKALEVRPDDADAHNNLGNALLDKGQADDAIAHLEKALELRPDFVVAHHNLASALLQRGRVDKAIAHFRRIVEIQPGSANAHNNLGWILRQAGRLDEAITHLQKALEIRPDYPEAHNNLGKALLQKGRVQEATAHYQTALKLQPDNAIALSNLAWVLATWPETSIRNGARAIELAQQANDLSGGQDPVILRTLSAAYAEGGRFAEAITTARRALLLADAQSNAPLADALRSQIKLHRAGSPLRDTIPVPQLAQ